MTQPSLFPGAVSTEPPVWVQRVRTYHMISSENNSRRQRCIMCSSSPLFFGSSVESNSSSNPLFWSKEPMSPATPCFLVPFGAILFFRVRPRFVHHATRGRPAGPPDDTQTSVYRQGRWSTIYIWYLVLYVLIAGIRYTCWYIAQYQVVNFVLPVFCFFDPYWLLYTGTV